MTCRYKEDKCKEFPLSAAAYAKHPAIVEWLLKQVISYFFSTLLLICGSVPKLITAYPMYLKVFCTGGREECATEKLLVVVVADQRKPFLTFVFRSLIFFFLFFFPSTFSSFFFSSFPQDGICPNQTTSDTGCTALYSACHVGCLGTVQVLMQVVGLDPNLPRADDGATPLYVRKRELRTRASSPV